jgi:hypothetical protein
MQQAGFGTDSFAAQELHPQGSHVNVAGSFAPLGTTGIMRPVGEELLQYNAGDDDFIQDADDSNDAREFSERGTYLEADVDIPQSRVKSFFGNVGNRLTGRKKEKLGNAPSTWLGVDEDFDARKAGGQIGSWDNFSEDDDDDNGWRGGAYGGRDFKENAAAMMTLSSELLNKEVWLVATGAHETKRVGIKNLLALYGAELRNAVFINVVGVGRGDLCYTVSEGNFRPMATDARLQQLIAEAAESARIPMGSVALHSLATDNTEILRDGGRGVSLIGMARGVPAGWNWTDDDLTHIDERRMRAAVDVLLETIKSS